MGEEAPPPSQTEQPTTDPRSLALREWLNRKQSENRASLGLSFRDLHCHGIVSSGTVQHTVISSTLVLPKYLLGLVSKRAPKKVQILRDFNGAVQDGEMLLVLGRPGSGCSTFLKALAGDTHGIQVDEAAKVNYQGISYRQLHREFKGESIYLAEIDVHFPELTLGDTVTFAAAMRETGTAQQSTARQTGRDIATLFDLGGAFETQIGDAMIRGISGGEKRRTSIAEALISDAQFQCWDNSTRGLDSLTALRFIELLREITSTLRRTVVMSIYQASEAMYRKFDKVTLLYEGRQIYFGPTESAADYFYDLGFARPRRATTPDFLTSLTNPAERIVREGFEDRVPRSPDEFAAAWRSSRQAWTAMEEVTQFESSYPIQAVRLGKQSEKHDGKDLSGLDATTYTISIALQIFMCLKRGLLRLKNNYPPVVAGVVANSILALVVGSVFYNLPETSDSLDKRAVLLFFSLMICAFAPAFEVMTMWAQRPIVEKHHRYAFYHPFTEGVASMICDLPNKFATSVMFHITLYFMTNLRRSAGAFFTYYLFNFFIVLAMSMVFRTLGSLSRTLEQTMAPASIMVLLSIAYTGFVIPVPYMKPWLSWFRRVNPIAYTYESLMINEFQDRVFPCSSTIPAGPGYNSTGMDGKVCSAIGAVPGEADIQGTAYLALKYNYTPDHLWRNFGILVALMVIFCVTHLLAAEYIPARRSKGDVLLFKQDRMTSKSVKDTESAGQPAVFAQDINKRREDNPKAETSVVVQTIHDQPTVFHWNDVCYDVKTQDGTRRILKSIDGWVKPGTLTALMGVTGAGKTTLLDVLAHRATSGTPSGEIFINGKLRDASFQRKMGYVQQDDIHLPTATVREALEFSALSRQPHHVPTKEKLGYVDKVMGMLEMESFADAIVGVPGGGLNIEQRRRLSIGVEMVAKPDLQLFLDEPTSGLDSQTAWSICMLLRKLADHGQGILCTIHQPSSQLFQIFDSLLLLNRQGETVYFGDIGENASTLTDYFESNGAPQCASDENPAEWILSVTNAIPEPTEQRSDSPPEDWSRAWETSKQKQAVVGQIAALREAVETTTTVERGSEYAVPVYTQLLLVTKRIFQEYWRDPTYIYSKMALCAGLSLFNGISFYNTPLDIQGLTNLVFSTFLISQLFSTVDQQVIPRLVSSRALFETRERRSKSYSWTVFLASNVIVELVWQTVASVLVFVAWYYPTGLWKNGDAAIGTAERGGLVFMLIWLFCLWITTFSQAVGVAIEIADTSVQIATLCFWLSLVFCGVLVSPDNLPRFWIFVYRVSPLTYFINGVVFAGLANTQISCTDVEILHINPPALSTATCSAYLGPYVQFAGGYIENPNATTDCLYCPVSETNQVMSSLGLTVDIVSAWRDVGFMAAYVIFNILAVFAIYWAARVPRSKA